MGSLKKSTSLLKLLVKEPLVLSGMQQGAVMDKKWENIFINAEAFMYIQYAAISM